MVNLFIGYALDTWSQDLNADFTLKDGLFGSVKVTKNSDTDKYSYSRYGIRGKNVVLFGVALNSSLHIGDKGKDILFLGKKQALDKDY